MHSLNWTKGTYLRGWHAVCLKHEYDRETGVIFDAGFSVGASRRRRRFGRLSQNFPERTPNSSRSSPPHPMRLFCLCTLWLYVCTTRNTVFQFNFPPPVDDLDLYTGCSVEETSSDISHLIRSEKFWCNFLEFLVE